MNDITFQKNRFIDLSHMSYERGIYTFTDFLTLAEQSDLHDCERDLYVKYDIYGGFEGAERIMIRFGCEEDLGYLQPYPIVCIRISPLQAKFAENLSHRDYLGSLMNLGIERHKLGDILIKGSDGYVFAEEDISDYICHELTRIRHTSITASVIDNPDDIPGPQLKEEALQVKSERIDAIVAKAYNLSRSQSAELFGLGKIFINGRLMENESHILKPGDTVSARGYGKFVYRSISGTTKKGNLYVTIEKFV